jgi:hypothetical protein
MPRYPCDLTDAQWQVLKPSASIDLPQPGLAPLRLVHYSGRQCAEQVGITSDTMMIWR